MGWIQAQTLSRVRLSVSQTSHPSCSSLRIPREQGDRPVVILKVMKMVLCKMSIIVRLRAGVLTRHSGEARDSDN